MRESFARPRLVATGLVLALLVTSVFAPVAGAEDPVTVRSVGEIFVDAAGRASGQNVQTSIVEASGILEAFTAVALGAEIFSTVEIDGFTQAEKLQGVGSSTILLRGSNAVVSLYDNINAAFKVQATEPTTVRYDLSEGVYAEARGQHALDLYEDNGAYLGSLVLVGGNGAATRADAITVADGAAEARLNTGSQIVWHARPVYLDSAAYNDAVVDAMAEGRLSSLVVTEFEGASEQQSRIDYFSHVQSETRTEAGQSVSTKVTSRAQESAVLAYDLAYETLAVHSSDDVAFYVDGQAAARATSAAEVRENADAGIASYYALTANGRTQVLASTPDFRSQAEHSLTLVSRAATQVSSESQAKAEARSESEARAVGDFFLHANGRLTGAFTTSRVDREEARVYDYTSLASRVTVFKSIALDGSAQAEARKVSDHEMQISTPNADLTLVDDAYGSLLVESRNEASAVFELGAGVTAVAESANMVRLEGPNGYAGMLIVPTPPGQHSCQAVECNPANGALAGSGKLAVTAEGTVRAQLEENGRLVYREASVNRAYASEHLVASAVAEGRVGAQFLAGFNGRAIATSAVEYAEGVSASAVTEARGRFAVDYTAHADYASSFVFDTRGTALAAKSTKDVTVLVNGEAATAVSTPQAVFAQTGEAKYFVESGFGAASRILVNTAGAAGENARVTIESQVAAAARAAVNQDAFGNFKTFQDGTAIGSFVTLKADQEAGVVHDFSLMGTGETVFGMISAGSGAFVMSGGDGTSQINLENDATRLQFMDTTNAYMQLVARQSTDAQFTLAEGVQAEKKAAGVIALSNEAGAHIGSMIITNVEGRAAAASAFETPDTSTVVAHLEQSTQVIFRTHVGVEKELDVQERDMMNSAIAAGRVAGHVVVQTTPSLSAEAYNAAAAAANAQAGLEATAATAVDGGATAIGAVEHAGRATTSVTTSYYSDVQMITAATQDRVDVTISSATSVGKTVIISLDPATVTGLAEGNAEILVDGKAAAQAESYSDILNPLDDGGVFEYFVLAGEAGTQVLVSLPHFSTHTVTLKAKEAGSAPVFMYATLFLSLLVVAETAFLVRSRRNA